MFDAVCANCGKTGHKIGECPEAKCPSCSLIGHSAPVYEKDTWNTLRCKRAVMHFKTDIDMAYATLKPIPSGNYTNARGRLQRWGSCSVCWLQHTIEACPVLKEIHADAAASIHPYSTSFMNAFHLEEETKPVECARGADSVEIPRQPSPDITEPVTQVLQETPVDNFYPKSPEQTQSFLQVKVCHLAGFGIAPITQIIADIEKRTSGIVFVDSHLLQKREDVYTVLRKNASARAVVFYNENSVVQPEIPRCKFKYFVDVEDAKICRAFYESFTGLNPEYWEKVALGEEVVPSSEALQNDADSVRKGFAEKGYVCGLASTIVRRIASDIKKD